MDRFQCVVVCACFCWRPRCCGVAVAERVPSCPCTAGDRDAAKTGPHVVGHVRGLT